MTEAVLPEIPLFDVGKAGPILLIEEAPEKLDEIVRIALDYYGTRIVAMGDRASRLWLVRANNPYLPEIASVADLAAPRGAFLLNLSYEWSCTTGTAPDPEDTGNRMLRTLDWPLPGLGCNVVVSRQEKEAGPYYNVTWPGFVGVLTAMAPGRFSAAISQPPLRRISGIEPLDWALGRLRLLMSGELPPSHLLRRVFDTCHDYEEARHMLITVPLCLPAFFTLSGTESEQCCIIERTEFTMEVHDGPRAMANHWLEKPNAGHDRGLDSRGRLDAMDAVRAQTHASFDWVAPPVLNETTRLAVEANARRGTLKVQGWEEDGPATKIFRLEPLPSDIHSATG